jgi:hypothetical protein
MTKHKLSIALFLLGHWACNASPNNIKGSVNSKTIATKSDATADVIVVDDDAEPYKSESKNDTQIPSSPGTDVIESESVSIPSPISGALLFCQEISNTQIPKHKKQVGCALKNDDERKLNRDLTAFKSHKWSFSSFDVDAILTSDLPASTSYQAIFLVSARHHDPNAFINAKLNVTLNYVEQDDRAYESKARLQLQILRWVPLNNKAIPKNALIAGTESGGTVQSPICRYHYGNQLIPGKVQTDYKGGSVCFGSVDGNYITTGSSYYDTDVLVSDVDTKEYFEWVQTTNGIIPELAFQGGNDANGKAVYVCRGNSDRTGKPYPSTAEYPGGEPSPGYAKNDGKGCTWQYYDLITSKNFEVLVWKSAAIKNMMK